MFGSYSKVFYICIRQKNKTRKTMKTYTAIYDTKSIKGINYSFTAKDMNSAIQFSNWKFDMDNVSNFIIIQD